MMGTQPLEENLFLFPDELRAGSASSTHLRPKNASPNFIELLSSPIVPDALPSDFDAKREAANLDSLWESNERFRQFKFKAFVHAGGSGLVFRVTKSSNSPDRALKIAREKLLRLSPAKEGVARNLSPVSANELKALEALEHPGIVNLFESIESTDPERGVIGISTSYISDPTSLSQYMQGRIRQAQDASDPEAASRLLALRLEEISEALAHMHDRRIFHFDLKPANTLISAAYDKAIITDLGSCIHLDQLPKHKKDVRAYFTWAYAHPDLREIISNPAGISEGGLKSSADIKDLTNIQRYDLFSLGRTIQECLGTIYREYGSLCLGSYTFKYLHVLAALMLDGRNRQPEKENNFLQEIDGIHLVTDIPPSTTRKFLDDHKIENSNDFADRLARIGDGFVSGKLSPEFCPTEPKRLSAGLGRQVPLTPRAIPVIEHPAFQRLKDEYQLTSLIEVFPAATHNRWAHTVGVFGNVIDYYRHLLQDRESPAFRAVFEREDFSHALAGALLQDLGRTSHSHLLEQTCPHIYQHWKTCSRLLDEKRLGETTLREAFNLFWPEVDLERVSRILQHNKGTKHASGSAAAKETPNRVLSKPIDAVAVDILDGPIDADKLDHIRRDGASCDVAYGAGIDTARFFDCLTTSVVNSRDGYRMSLAYRAKGSAAIESVIFARYQLYSAVYWHHTRRCIQSMLAHTLVSTFGSTSRRHHRLRGANVAESTIQDAFYFGVVCALQLRPGKKGPIDYRRKLPEDFYTCTPPFSVSQNRFLEFIWRFADDRNRLLIERLSSRYLYKRLFEIRLDEMGSIRDYSEIRSSYSAEARESIATEIETWLLEEVAEKLRSKSTCSQADETALAELEVMIDEECPLVVVDFPEGGIAEQSNFPVEVRCGTRKMITGVPSTAHPSREYFTQVREFQRSRASLRIFVAPELLRSTMRLIEPSEILSFLRGSMPHLKQMLAHRNSM